MISWLVTGGNNAKRVLYRSDDTIAKSRSEELTWSLDCVECGPGHSEPSESERRPNVQEGSQSDGWCLSFHPTSGSWGRTGRLPSAGLIRRLQFLRQSDRRRLALSRGGAGKYTSDESSGSLSGRCETVFFDFGEIPAEARPEAVQQSPAPQCRREISWSTSPPLRLSRQPGERSPLLRHRARQRGPDGTIKPAISAGNLHGP